MIEHSMMAGLSASLFKFHEEIVKLPMSEQMDKIANAVSCGLGTWEKKNPNTGQEFDEIHLFGVFSFGESSAEACNDWVTKAGCITGSEI